MSALHYYFPFIFLCFLATLLFESPIFHACWSASLNSLVLVFPTNYVLATGTICWLSKQGETIKKQEKHRYFYERLSELYRMMLSYILWQCHADAAALRCKRRRDFAGRGAAKGTTKRGLQEDGLPCSCAKPRSRRWGSEDTCSMWGKETFRDLKMGGKEAGPQKTGSAPIDQAVLQGVPFTGVQVLR